MNHFEDSLQISCIHWFRIRFPKLLILAIPNAGKRNVVAGARLKKMGMLAGVPDMFIPLARSEYHGLFVELKIGKNKMSPAQVEVSTALFAFGYLTIICRSLDEFIEKVTEYYNS